MENFEKSLINYFNELVPNWKYNIEELLKKIINDDNYVSAYYLYIKVGVKLDDILYLSAKANKDFFIRSFVDLNDECFKLGFINYYSIVSGFSYSGNFGKVKQYIAEYTNLVDKCNKGAIKYINISGRTFLLSRKIKDIDNDIYDLIAYSAALGGNIEIVKYALENGAENFTEILGAAASKGYFYEFLDVVDITKTDISIVAGYAASGGFYDVVGYLYGIGNIDYNIVAAYAIETGKIFYVNEIIYKGVELDNKTMAKYAAAGGYLEGVMMFFGNGENIKSLVKKATKYGHLEIIKWLVMKGFNDFNFIGRYYDGNYNILMYVLENGANNYDEMASIAAKKGNLLSFIELSKYKIDYEKIYDDIADDLRISYFAWLQIGKVNFIAKRLYKKVFTMSGFVNVVNSITMIMVFIHLHYNMISIPKFVVENFTNTKEIYNGIVFGVILHGINYALQESYIYVSKKLELPELQKYERPELEFTKPYYKFFINMFNSTLVTGYIEETTFRRDMVKMLQNTRFAKLTPLITSYVFSYVHNYKNYKDYVMAFIAGVILYYVYYTYGETSAVIAHGVTNLLANTIL